MSPGNCDGGGGSKLMRNQDRRSQVDGLSVADRLLALPKLIPRGCFGEGRRRCPLDPLGAWGCAHHRLEYAHPGLKVSPALERVVHEDKGPPLFFAGLGGSGKAFYKLASQTLVVLSWNIKVLTLFSLKLEQTLAFQNHTILLLAGSIRIPQSKISYQPGTFSFVLTYFSRPFKSVFNFSRWKYGTFLSSHKDKSSFIRQRHICPPSKLYCSFESNHSFI